MSRLVAILFRLPLLVAILATALALGTLVPAQSLAATAIADTVTVLAAAPDASNTDEGAATAEAEQPEADPHSLPDAVLAALSALPSPPRLRPAIGGPDREFSSRLSILDRPPASPRLEPRGGRSG